MSATPTLTDRRSLLRNCAGFLAFALLTELGIARAGTSSASVRNWVTRQRDLTRDLRTGAIAQLQWHDEVNALARDLDLEQLAFELQRARTRDAGVPFGHDPQKRFVTLLDDEGHPLELGYGLALFDFRGDSVITPHAHRHMVSAHMVIEGKVRVRTFDRVRDEDGALVIRPTGDVIAGPGHPSAMTTPRDNVHWFVPRSARAMTLDLIIDGLDPGMDDYLIQPVDPLGGDALPDGTIRAPLISFERSMALYGAQHRQ